MAQARRSSEAALLRAAGRVFAEKGFHSTTIDDIAVAAGVSRPTVYAYTRSKGQLCSSASARPWWRRCSMTRRR